MKLIVFITFCLGALRVVLGLAPGVESLTNGWGPEKAKQYSGYITVNTNVDNGGHLFFWLFESRQDPVNDPLVLWMTGGPGCSSELAVFFEQGPYRLNGSNVSINPHAWNEHANVLFIDQPVGTGFSYADRADDYVVNEEQVGEDMYEFLQTFYEQFPQFKQNDFYVTGESYAGHYVPAVSSRIFRGNKNCSGDFKIPLRGLAIGNGMVNARTQMGDYVNFAVDKKLLKDEAQIRKLRMRTELCQSLLKSGYTSAAEFVCNSIISSIAQDGGNFNVYDIRAKCSHPPLCYDFGILDVLMKRADVQKALGIPSRKAKWTECNSVVYADLQGDWFTECDQYLPEMLENGIRMLIYFGKEDFICNYYGGLDWVSKLQWSGQHGYNQRNPTDWMVQGSRAGSYVTQGPLTLLMVENAGHMVPMDQPANALSMLQQFLKKDGFPNKRVIIREDVLKID